MSDTKDSARPDATPDEKQRSATTPETPPGDKAELTSADLGKVSGGSWASEAIHRAIDSTKRKALEADIVNEVAKDLGNALGPLAR